MVNDKLKNTNRAHALDALRGFAILTMVLSGVIPYKVLPSWMYHAQIPPPSHQFNPDLPGLTWVDLVFPLLKSQGLYGGLFFDTGRVYGDRDKIEFDFTDLRQSAGLGIRWISPLGPIRIEYGFILDPEDTDHGPGNWEFSMASSF